MRFKENVFRAFYWGCFVSGNTGIIVSANAAGRLSRVGDVGVATVSCRGDVRGGLQGPSFSARGSDDYED